jgi:hypothetical protein
MLELRRTMLAGRERYPPINVAALRDKRERGLLKFKPYLNSANFAKLVFLLHGLAPALVSDLIERETKSLNGDGTPERRREIIRKYLYAVLEGFPGAAPLFPNGNFELKQ